jgi:hypothetical protein
MGWRGIKNGALLDLMAEEFQPIVTTDKNLPFQQNLAKRRIAAVILPSNRIRIVIELIPKIESSSNYYCARSIRRTNDLRLN